jgi:hypothetical protein
MKPTQKIQLELYTDKADEFYLSLLKYKLSATPDLKTLQSLADAIHFDKDSWKLWGQTEEQQKKINDKLHDIHIFLLKSKKYSKQYFTISKGSFEEFIQSPFSKDLRNIFFRVDLMQAWRGKEESAEVKAMASAITFFVTALAEAFTRHNKKIQSQTLNPKQALNDNLSFNVKPNKKGNLVVKNGHDTIEMEFFIEKSGEIKKIKAGELENLSGNIVFYIRTKEVTAKIETKGDEIEITRYENVKVKNQQLDLSKATLVDTASTTQQEIEKGLEEDEKGNISFNAAKTDVAETEPKEIAVYNYEEIIQEEQGKKKEEENDKKINFHSSEEVFTEMDKQFTQFLKLPKDSPEKTQARDKIIIQIYELVKQHYPSFTIHAYSTTAGYIASKMNLLDTEEKHGTKLKRNASYRQYLTKTVYNILRANFMIEK